MDRGTRYSDLLSQELLAGKVCSVIGVGAIGHQIARSLAIMGVGEIRLFDPDTVSVENLGTQGWAPGQMGLRKVLATDQELSMLAFECQIYPLSEAIEPGDFGDAAAQHIKGDVFVAVDSMEARRHIWWRLTHTPVEWGLLVDGRMGAEVLQVHTAYQVPYDNGRQYEATLGDEGTTREPCTRRATFYCANVAAGFAVAEWTKMLRGHDAVPYGLRLSLLEAIVERLDAEYWK